MELLSGGAPARTCRRASFLDGNDGSGSELSDELRCPERAGSVRRIQGGLPARLQIPPGPECYAPTPAGHWGTFWHREGRLARIRLKSFAVIRIESEMIRSYPRATPRPARCISCVPERRTPTVVRRLRQERAEWIGQGNVRRRVRPPRRGGSCRRGRPGGRGSGVRGMVRCGW